MTCPTCKTTDCRCPHVEPAEPTRCTSCLRISADPICRACQDDFAEMSRALRRGW